MNKGIGPALVAIDKKYGCGTDIPVLTARISFLINELKETGLLTSMDIYALSILKQGMAMYANTVIQENGYKRPSDEDMDDFCNKIKFKKPENESKSDEDKMQ